MPPMTIEMNPKSSQKEDKDFAKIREERIKKMDKERENNKIKEKDDKGKKKKSKKKIIILVVVLFIVLSILGAIGYFGWRFYKMSKDIGFNFDISSVIEESKPELKKDSTGNLTNALIVGIDTREKGGGLNTDTIILVSYNYTTNDVTMVSIPRDFHVETYEGSNWYQRINAIYAYAEDEKEGSGLQALCDVVTDVTGQEIQYYAMVDFTAFVDIVDTLGGVDINVENSFTDYSYPASNYKYQTISFVAGPQTMDGETALQYARSRHSSQNGEGSDYSRARRQQKVIEAVQAKIFSSETLTNPKTLMSIISSLSENIKVSEFSLEDVNAAIELGKNYQNGGKMYSFVLDPTSGASSLIEVKTMPSGAYAIGPVAGFGNYNKIIDYVTTVLANPAFYSEQPVIYVYDVGLGYTNTVAKVTELEEAFPYVDIIFSATLFKDKTGNVVYSTSNDYPNSVAALAKYLETESTTQPDYITNKLGYEKVTVLLGGEVVEENISETTE